MSLVSGIWWRDEVANQLKGGRLKVSRPQGVRDRPGGGDGTGSPRNPENQKSFRNTGEA